MTIIKSPTKDETPPDQRPLTSLQAKRLAALAGVSVKEVEGQKIAQLSERLKWKLDPILFLFRQICGRVVKKDPVTGVEYPVPFATVYVEDTDCNFISYFPKPWPWGWHFPLFCHREVIGTTTTDACGNFCVWVPRFDIDWILRWRLERVCFPIIFRRPNIGDLIPKLPVPVDGPWPPVPGPDPGPLKNLTTLPPSMVEAIAGSAAGKLAQQIARLQTTQSLGSANQLKDQLLNARAFATELPPPLPTEFHQALAGQNVVAAKGASASEGVRSAIALKLGLDPAAKEIASFNPQRFIGPFFRCYDVFVPEWQIILDVPDITFRVTQDVNGNGTPVTIYSEGYFDVRWDANPLPNVTLVASAIAKESHVCETPVVPCGNVPAILFAGLMPLNNAAYFDAANGYALRPNRPSTASSNPPCPNSANPPRLVAQAPFCETLQLYGCVNVAGAKFYRIVQSTDGGTTFSAITGLPLNLYTFPGGVPVTNTPDVAGWYAVLANPDDYHPARMILEWPTPTLGQSILKIEIGDGSKAVIGSSATVAIQTDNTYPQAPFTTLAWKFAGDPDSSLQSLLGMPCPLIKRGSTPRDIEIVFEVSVSAHHLRNACLYASGCGGGSFTLVTTDPLNNPGHWHTNALDNSVLLHQRYALAAGTLAGCYSFGSTAYSRAMNPSGADGGNLVNWLEDTYVFYTAPSLPVAVVNEN